MTDLTPPNVITKFRAAVADNYVVERELGRGGMATVFLARDVKHEREVAIKVLHPELAASLGGERFEREIRLAAKLQHPHILGMFDSGNANGLLYYVMPFVKGEALRDRIDREGMLPVEEAVAIALEVADALGYAHAQGVVHRDIKPENILLSGGHALVADFGIARAIEPGVQKLTVTGMSMGTPYYMPPEQASGEVVGPTADLYSLGCVLYEMLSGEPPFNGKNAMQIMARHAMEQVPSIRIVRANVPEEVEEAIFAAMGKSPADRPQTAAAFAELFGLDPGVTTSMRARTMTRRVPSGATVATASMNAAMNPNAPRPWWRTTRAAAAGITVVALAGFGAYSMRGGKKNLAVGPNANRVAVLYFKDLSKDRSLGPVASGLTEGLIRSLSSPSVTVISRSGVDRFRGTSVAADSIAKALRVGYLVNGDVERTGDEITVNIRLEDASGANLDRKEIHRPAKNVISLGDTLAVIAADLIKKQLGTEMKVRDQRAATDDAAWLLAQRGAVAQKNGEGLNAKGDTAGLNREFNTADSLYAAAEAVDSKWVDPVWMRAALAYRRSRLAAGDPAAMRKWVGVGVGHADRAVAIDRQSPDAFEMRGSLRYWAFLQTLEPDAAKLKALLTTARADLEESTKLNNGQAGAYAVLSHLYNFVGASSDVAIAAQRAWEADEFQAQANLVLQRLFNANYDMGNFDKAEYWCNVARERFPSDFRAVRCRLYQLTMATKTPDLEKARALADTVVSMVPVGAQPRERLTENMLYAAVLARASKQRPELADSARRLARASEGTSQNDPSRDLAYFGAFVHALLGDKDDAFRLLKIYLVASPQQVVVLRNEPGWWFRDLATDPRYKQLVGGP